MGYYHLILFSFQRFASTKGKGEALLRLFPIRATARGDNRFNNLLHIDFTDPHRAKLKKVYDQFHKSLLGFNREALSESDKLNYDVLKQDIEIEQESLKFKTNRIPFNQKTGLPISLVLYGSGTGLQPFKTVADYDNWLHRAAVFPAWSDSAIV